MTNFFPLNFEKAAFEYLARSTVMVSTMVENSLKYNTNWEMDDHVWLLEN